MFDESTARAHNPATDEQSESSERASSPGPVGVTKPPTMNPNPNPERPTEGPTRKENENMSEDFAAVLESFEAEQSANAEAAPTDESVVKGTVINVTDKFLAVDIGNKSDGM